MKKEGGLHMLISEKNPVRDELDRFEKKVRELSKQEMKELLLIQAYKTALVRSQVEAITEILIKNKVTTYEEVWRKTNEIFKDSSL